MSKIVQLRLNWQYTKCISALPIDRDVGSNALRNDHNKPNNFNTGLCANLFCYICKSDVDRKVVD